MARGFPVYLEPGSAPEFPDPRRCDAEGMVAIGADLAPERLLAAYRAGIFPWFDERVPPLWWSPDPRGVLTAASLHVSRRLERTLRQRQFETTWDRDFSGVMRGCGERRNDGTWLIPAMIAAYRRLHRLGVAHSLEVWRQDRLIGGLYGVHVGGLFAAESMFHRVRDASKIALVTAARHLFRQGIELIDVQFVTPHLRRMGAIEMSRRDYLDRVEALRDRQVTIDWLGAASSPGGCVPQ